MNTLIATTDGAGKTLESATVQALRMELRGSLLSSEDASYDETRQVWNGMIDRRPALIARCGGVADVIAAVRFAVHTNCSYPCAAAATTRPASRCARAA